MKVVIALGAIAVSGLAGCASLSANETEQFALKDGSRLIVFSDGKMTMRDKRGLPMEMKEGQAMEALDGSVISMHGNEVMRRTRQERELDQLYFGG